jgi:DNA-binding NarL/FixJ family response regulator
MNIARKRRSRLRIEDWKAVLAASAKELTEDERQIVELLIEGRTQKAIGRQLLLHRSAVWRKINAIISKRETT